MRLWLVMPVLLAALGTGERALAQELGRLFFSPQQRQDLDRRRTTNAQEAIVTREDKITLNGRVSRSSGKTTTWINGIPQNDQYRSPNPAEVTVRAGEDDPAVTLKVGQTHDRVSGETRDLLGGGRLKVDKNPRRASR